MLDKFIPAWSEASESDLGKVKVICFDVDDTFSTSGKISAEAYTSLWELHHAGYKLVPVTGRAAGWCDHMIRFWPVDAVVGENGAFVYYSDGAMIRRNETLFQSEKLLKKLLKLKKKLEKKFPNVTFASDQSFRDYDLAIDICEDVDPWSDDKVEELLLFCKQNGAMAKLSSIHVNAWYGDFDKSKGLQKWFNDGAPGLVGTFNDWGQWLFIGDSPNDEPLFKLFDQSIGVANLSKYITRLQSHPTWITKEPSGNGFVEIAKRFLN